MTDLERARQAVLAAYGPQLRALLSNTILSGDSDGSPEVQSALLAIQSERAAVVKWLMDHERCPFGKAPDFYATAIEKGEHHAS